MSTEQHEALELAARVHPGSSKWEQQVGSELIRMHALIAQFRTAFEGEHFEHEDQRAAIATATQYLKA